MRAPRRRAFLKGLVTTRPGPLVIGALITLLVALALQWIVASGLVAGMPVGRLLFWRHDDLTHVAWRVYGLRRDPPSNTPVYLLGGSSMRECVGTEAGFAERVQKDLGLSVSVVQLAQTQRNFAEDLAIVDNLPPGHGVLVVGVTFLAFRAPPSLATNQVVGVNLLLPSPSLRTYLVSKGYHVPPRIVGLLPGVIHHLVWYARWNHGALLHLRWPDFTYEYHWHDTGFRHSPADNRQVAREQLPQFIPVLKRNWRFNAGLLDTIISKAEAKGLRVLLVEQPANGDDLGPDWASVRKSYTDVSRAIAARHGATYVDLNSKVDLTQHDFFDLTHLVPSGRAKWEPALADAVAGVLRTPPAEPTTLK